LRCRRTPATGGTDLEDGFVEIIGDIADLHTFLDVCSTLDERIPDAGALRDDVNDSLKPDRILNGMRIAGKHFERAHHAERAVDEQGNVVTLHRPCITRFDDDGRFATGRRGIVEVAGCVKFSRAIAPDIGRAIRETSYIEFCLTPSLAKTGVPSKEVGLHA
jgi:hypothetical protein